MRDRTDRIILIVALLGLLVALYSISLHYATAPSKLCDINSTFSCDKVNKSPWSLLFGIPVAILGSIAYLGLILLVLLRKRIGRMLAFTQRDMWWYIWLFTTVMLAFQGYLTFVEFVWIHAYCIACLMSQAILILLFVLTADRWQNS